MADIEFVCKECAKPRVVSEFADVSKLKCAACGGPLCKSSDVQAGSASDGSSVSGGAPVPPGRLKRKPSEHAPAIKNPGFSPQPESAGESDEERPPLELHPKVRKKRGINHTLLALLVFVFCAGAMFHLRYIGGLPPSILQFSRDYAWVVVLILHGVVLLEAVKDNIFQGMLCLLVPGWSLIYLMFISDKFYLRALIAAGIVGFGQDGGVKIFDAVVQQSSVFSRWIDSGGGSISRR